MLLVGFGTEWHSGTARTHRSQELSRGELNAAVARLSAKWSHFDLHLNIQVRDVHGAPLARSDNSRQHLEPVSS